MTRLYLIVLSILIAVAAPGQSDPEAVKILDRFSATAQSAPSVSIKFRLITADQQAKTTDTVAGYLLMQKDQYRLEMPDNITWFNGLVSWNLLVAEKEVTIVRPDKKDDSFLSRPSSIFTIYRKGYKTRLVEEKSNSYTIDLYPEEIESDLVRIRLIINTDSYYLAGAEYRRKDGISIFLKVDEYDLSRKPDQTAFTFNPKLYKGVEIIDMR